MKNLLEQKKVRVFEALLGAILYTAIMGIGMLIMRSVFKVDYSQPEMVYIIGIVEVVLTFVVFFMVTSFSEWSEVGFNVIQIKQLIWFIPHLLVIGAMGLIFTNDVIKNWSHLVYSEKELLFAIGITTLLVGLSEEIMYRGIVLHSFSEDKRKFYGVLVSSISFSLLHSVNVFGGLSVSEVSIQLVNTYLLGFCFANFALRLKNIIPLIIFHWLWDFILIGSSVIGSQANEFGIYVFPINVIIGFVMWVTYKNKAKLNDTEKGNI